ncbi:hypothetical protein KIPB_004400 [Kipferlia bialata]|uniref:Uncharacterized protein n=1 Tax=Kipferlia bialata TaxID=797122 RepID=A0A391NKL7_9EUKA|nr:hypothetical protein KIPB_004400 [Kipferlia bialata]|eukprot:g4400.t1
MSTLDTEAPIGKLTWEYGPTYGTTMASDVAFVLGRDRRCSIITILEDGTAEEEEVVSPVTFYHCPLLACDGCRVYVCNAVPAFESYPADHLRCQVLSLDDHIWSDIDLAPVLAQALVAGEGDGSGDHRPYVRAIFCYEGSLVVYSSIMGRSKTYRALSNLEYEERRWTHTPCSLPKCKRLTFCQTPFGACLFAQQLDMRVQPYLFWARYTPKLGWQMMDREYDGEPGHQAKDRLHCSLHYELPEVFLADRPLHLGSERCLVAPDQSYTGYGMTVGNVLDTVTGEVIRLKSLT